MTIKHENTIIRNSNNCSSNIRIFNTNNSNTINRMKEDRREATERFATMATGISFLLIVILILATALFTSCSTTQPATIYGNQNSHCE